MAIAIFKRTFLITSAVLLCIAVGYIIYWAESREESVRGEIAGGYIPTDEDDVVVIAVFFEKKSEGPTAVGIMRFNAAEGRIPIAVFSPRLRLNINGKADTVYEIYKSGGIKKLRSAIEESLGVKTDRYITIDKEEFSEITGVLGDIQVNLKRGKKVGKLSLTTGSNSLSGKDMLYLMSYDGYEEGEAERIEMAADLLCGCVNSYLGKIISDGKTGYSEDILSLTENNFSYFDYEKYYDGMSFLSQIKKEPAVRIRPATVKLKDSEDYALIEESVEYIRGFFD